MKDERITLETAKLLKEKNFELLIQGLCTEYLTTQIDPEYPDGGGPFGWVKGTVDFSNDYIKNNSENDYSNENYVMYAVPTQSLLARWLREVHNIQVYCYSSTRNGKGEYRDYVVHVNLTPINDARDDEFQTYEEAFEVGLQVALDMI